MTHTPRFATIDGNEAAAYVAHRINEVCAIYPITPSSPMGELADAWSAANRPNIWGHIPQVVEMQSEGGAAGALHGALQAGALCTTFTASQGLLLMIPNMYKIAGELTPTVLHVTARSLACQALSIFGDHSDVMAARQTGFALLASASVQEAMDMALIAQAASLRSRIPFLHFFDGFRTSHEVSKIALIPEDVMRRMIPDELVAAHRDRALNPDRPVLRGSAQNPDVYFQARETVNPFYAACPGIVQRVMDEFAELTGRAYKLFDYVGAPDAERVVVLMASGCETADETVEALIARGEKVGVLKVRLFRPFDVHAFSAALPETVKALAVLDRTKEPGAAGEPLYQDVINALFETIGHNGFALKTIPTVVGGRYGLSSKEFSPAMVKAALDNLKLPRPKNHFVVGIEDDVTHASLPCDPHFSTEDPKVIRAMFFGLGSDGTVGANKNTIKIIGENTDFYAQGYFVYDSKKAGAVTVSHLRFGPRPIRSTYLIAEANFVGCHQFHFLEKVDVLAKIVPGGTFLLNAPYAADEVWGRLPRPVQQTIIDKQLKFYVIDATRVAADSGMGRRINTVMQTCFFALSGVLPRDEAIEQIKKSIRKTYGSKGDEVVRMNIQCVDNALGNLYEVTYPAQVTSTIERTAAVPADAPPYVRDVLARIIAGDGDSLPVSAFPCDGTFPTDTARWEKRNLALEIPVWDPEVCIQCGKCVMVCPHATIRMKVCDEANLAAAPPAFKSADARAPEFKGRKYTIQVAPEDCTGCELCVHVCPAKNRQDPTRKAINMEPQPLLRAQQAVNWDFFRALPEVDRAALSLAKVRTQQFQQPLFEFSGACAGCGETPYIKLLSQLFGDRALIANATGCSSIYGGNLPTTPWARDPHGRGPAWSNSLFEDNAEFGMGMRLAVDQLKQQATELLLKLTSVVGDELAAAILNAQQKTDADIQAQRARVVELKHKLAGLDTPEARRLLAIADNLVKRSVWIVGGDGWAYDIGYGGLDHVLASGRNVNVLVLDTEVYSNTGGQMSKSTPRGAVAKFAAGGKPAGKKNLGLMAMSYGNVYVAQVAMGARDEHTLQAFLEAEAFDGPSLIIAYAHCIAHGINMVEGLDQQKAAVDSGQWLLFRYHPDRAAEGRNPLQIDSKEPRISVADYMMKENRFRMLTKSDPQRARELFDLAADDARRRREVLTLLASQWASTEPAPAAKDTAEPVKTGS